MEGLTKQQIVLVTLLVSFVTSIATGIVTVSLMDQAPPGITQTINRVVERTIEKVVPSQNQAAVITKETVVVNADDQVIRAVAENSGNIVRIKEVTGMADSRKEVPVASGLVVTKDGLIVSDISVLFRQNDENGNPIPESYMAVLPNGKEIPVDVVGTDDANGIAFFRLLVPANMASKDIPTFNVPAFGNANLLKLGQAVIALGGADDNSVSTGIVGSLAEKQSPAGSTNATSTSGATPEKQISLIKTDIRQTDLALGSMLLNLSGEVVGLNVGKATVSKSSYLPINIVGASVTNFLASKQKATTTSTQ